MNQAPHQIDLLQWYMGLVEGLFGRWDNVNHPYIEVEHTTAAVLRFRSGDVGQIIAGNSQNPALYGRVCVHGSNGASIGVQTGSGAMFIPGMSDIKEPPINHLWTIRSEEERLNTWQKEVPRAFTFPGDLRARLHAHIGERGDSKPEPPVRAPLEQEVASGWRGSP